MGKIQILFGIMLNGGLPNRCEFTNEIDIKNYLYSVYDSIILRDVVKRLNLKDIVLFDMILRYLIETARQKKRL